MSAAKVAELRKVLLAACTVLGELVAYGVLHGTALHVGQALLAAAGLYGVYRVPNAPKP